MRTSVMMERNLLNMVVRQDSKTGMFCVNDLHKIGNSHRAEMKLKTKQVASYFNLDSTEDLIKSLCMEEDLSIEQVKKSKRGIAGGTWVHPILFLDIAMWYSPAFKVKVLKWVLDGLLITRNDSGDSFKKMNVELSKNFPNEFKNQMLYTRISNHIAATCRVGTGVTKWQKATIEQLKLRDMIQNNIVLLADVYDSVGTCIRKATEKTKKQYADKEVDKELNH